MRKAWANLSAEYHIQPNEIGYDRFVLVRLLFESLRDAGLWNLHWTITNKPPNSDLIWHQWQLVAKSPAFAKPTASAECDELSALFAFVARKAGIKDVGLFWPAPNHTVAVWTIHSHSRDMRIVVPTTQIFLEESDLFGTRSFDPWTQKTIFEYSRQDVPDSFDLPASLVQFFLLQIDKYAGATDITLQRLRYLREGVFLNFISPEEAATQSIMYSHTKNLPHEDLEALKQFADDTSTTMRQLLSDYNQAVGRNLALLRERARPSRPGGRPPPGEVKKDEMQH